MTLQFTYSPLPEDFCFEGRTFNFVLPPNHCLSPIRPPPPQCVAANNGVDCDSAQRLRAPLPRNFSIALPRARGGDAQALKASSSEAPRPLWSGLYIRQRKRTVTEPAWSCRERRVSPSRAQRPYYPPAERCRLSARSRSAGRDSRGRSSRGRDTGMERKGRRPYKFARKAGDEEGERLQSERGV